MVAPLDVHAVVLQQGVADDVRPGPPIEDVAHQVEPIHGGPLDEVADGGDQVRGLADGDDGGDDVLEVVLLIQVLPVGVEELVQDVGEVGGQSLADLGPGVPLAGGPGHLDEPVDGDPVPLVQVLDLGLDLLQLLLGIVDEGGQLVELVPGNHVGEQLVQPLPDHAGAGVEDMEEGLVLPVDVGDEVLAALGQVHDGVQIDDLRGRGPDGGEHAGQHFEIAQVIFRVRAMLCHGQVSLYAVLL